MNNKWLIAILVLLVIIAGGGGYYSYTLNQQVDNLSERITAYEEEQKARIDDISGDIDVLRADTQKGLYTLENQLSGARSEIDSLTTELAGTEEQINSVTSQVTTLDERVTGAETAVAGLADSIVDIPAIYAKVVKATVRITDGEYTVGTGFIYDTSGRVVTAYHVIDELTNIHVMMYDGQVSRARVVGYSDFSDIAVLKLYNNPEIDPLPLGDSTNMSIGAPVMAIGSPLPNSDNPLGYKDMLTSGIVSQVNRMEKYGLGFAVANLLQFDAAVNFGNSGGPLFDSTGNVIGVVVARIDPTLGEGIYWAVASNKVKRVAEAIINDGSFAYPWVGVGISNITPEYAVDNSLGSSNGVLVGSVFSGSPADIAGFLVGDIITAVDGVTIRDTGELTSYLGEFSSPGDKIVIDVRRGIAHLQLTVTVGTREP